MTGVFNDIFAQFQRDAGLGVSKAHHASKADNSKQQEQQQHLGTGIGDQSKAETTKHDNFEFSIRQAMDNDVTLPLSSRDQIL